MKTTVLCILDGFGFNPNSKSNAVASAKKPVIDSLLAKWPHSTLTTFGEAVGLPAGQMGNSEVGHLNIGAGRVIEQWLLRISRALTGTFLSTSKEYQGFLTATQESKVIHVIGLYSSGGVHSNLEHLKLLVRRLATDTTTSQIALHLLSDGRDVAPNAFVTDLQELLVWLKDYPRVTIASICGRFYAMDRDKRWKRVKVAYDAIVNAQGTHTTDLIDYVKQSYAKGTTDEFLEPAVTGDRAFQPGDGVVFWNFREDRMREIVSAICNPSFKEFERTRPVPSQNEILCFTEYDHSLKLPFLFEQLDIQNHLGETVSKAGLKQLRVAETEKYPHVTYFLNGGIETPYNGEDRKLVPSPRDVKTYDQKPEMSAFGVAELVVEGIRSGEYSLIVVNFANCDMVGHTGDLSAATKAVETVDTCLGQLLAALENVDGNALIIADHGNAEQMVNYETGTPHTAHTTYPVPVIAVNVPGVTALRDGGALCDVAPTILKMMDLPQPHEMTGKSLY